MINPNTSVTLLGRLRANPLDQSSWNEFVERYGGTLLRWCREWGLQLADAEDVTQEVLTQLAKQMSSFEYDPNGRFRSWLKTIAYRAWCDFIARRQRNEKCRSASVEILRLLDTEEARNGFLQRLDEEAERNLLEDAMKLVQLRVEPHTWRAFEATAFGGEKGEEVAERLGMQVATVYVAKSKVTRMIKEEIARLDNA